mmetsp:Transcript_34230/g.45250  ORF Transcript_34230/g.45250 Transcript_34230/m.45250 type:complete len:127 (+) Transcript_34230:1137-1517(+)
MSYCSTELAGFANKSVVQSPAVTVVLLEGDFVVDFVPVGSQGGKTGLKKPLELFVCLVAGQVYFGYLQRSVGLECLKNSSAHHAEGQQNVLVREWQQRIVVADSGVEGHYSERFLLDQLAGAPLVG